MSQTIPKLQKPAQSDVKVYLLSFVGIAIMCFFSYLPAPDPITPLGMKIIGIFLGTIFLWTFVSILWPSIVGIVALGFAGYAPFPKVIMTTFGEGIAVAMLFLMIFFGALQHYQIPRHISYWLLTRKIINGRPATFSFVVLYTTYILTGLSGNSFAMIIFMWAILYSLFEDVGYKKGDAYANMMLVGVAFAAGTGQALKPFVASPLVIMSAYEKVAGTQLNYLMYMIFGFTMATIILALYCATMKYIVRIDMSKIASISIEQFTKNPLPPMDRRQKLLFYSIFLLIGSILLPNVSKEVGIMFAPLKTLGPWGLGMLFTAALLIIRFEGKPILDFKEVIGRYMLWDVYFLVILATAISGVLTSPDTGVSPFLLKHMAPLLEGMSPYLCIITVLMLSFCITQVANNAVMGAMFMPVLGIICEQTGFNFAAAATLMCFTLHVALLTPAASPYAAMLYGNTEWLEKRTIFKYVVCILLAALLIYATIGTFVAEFMFSVSA